MEDTFISKPNVLSKRSVDVILVAAQFGILIAIFARPSAGLITFPQFASVVGPVLFVCGTIVGILGIIGLRRSLSIFPTPVSHADLVQNGVYKYIRHPMYTGLIIVALSCTLDRLSIFGITLFLSFVILLFVKSSYEERLLLSTFKNYESYRQKTGRFFIKF